MDFIETLRKAKIKRSWVAIGAFDGVHLGHQVLFKQLMDGACHSGCTSAVITFDPLPAIFFKRENEGIVLTATKERVKLIEATGVDKVIVLEFTQALANVDAESFMKTLKDTIGIERLLAGHNFMLGKDRKGTVDALKELGKQIGYEVEVVAPIMENSDLVSSSRIRQLLRNGEVSQANRFLGRPYSLEGLVVHGEHRGGKLGYPTANLAIPAERLLPANGVYACKATVEGKTYHAVTNIGVRPTFDSPLPAPRVEPHLLDTEEHFYDKYLNLEFIEHLRPELKFPDAQLLITQIQKDVEKARRILSQ